MVTEDKERSIEIKEEIDTLQSEVANLKLKVKDRLSRIAKLWTEYYKLNPKTEKTPAQRNWYQGPKPDDILKRIKDRKPNFDYE